MGSTKERRRKKRWKVAVLVRCSLPKLSDDVFEMEMWAKDVNEKGMQLEWSRGLNASHLNKGASDRPQSVRFEDLDFSKGDKVKVQDLFYDDEGSPFIEGRITWARKASANGNWALGVKFLEPQKQSSEMAGAFKDFLSIVKNPVAAIEKASKRR